jgi:hypothetical protein
LSEPQTEVILAQEQGATIREGGKGRELQAEFGVGAREGTLVLTNKRLIFVCTNERGEDLPIGFYGDHLLLYSEVEDLDSILGQPPNIFIPLAAASVKGHKGELGRPSLEVSWKDQSGSHDLVFTETLIGRRNRNLNDWAPVMENLKAGKQKLLSIPPLPPIDTLKGKIMHVLSDMQEKGVFSIEETVETEYGLDLDPDDVQAACEELTKDGLLIRSPELTGDAFYRRLSPLG